MPMLFYVPPLLPVVASSEGGPYEVAPDLLTTSESARLPIRYLATLFSAGDPAPVVEAYRKLVALRYHRRATTVGDFPLERATRMLEEAGLTVPEADAMYRLTAIADLHERFVVPPMQREQAIASLTDVHDHQEAEGAGFLRPPRRGW